jgi:hypothetical protein
VGWCASTPLDLSDVQRVGAGPWLRLAVDEGAEDEHLMTVEFPDLSNNNGAVDISAAPALIVKATEGTGFVDAYYAGHRDHAHAMGIPFAGYHYLHQGDAAAQAAQAFSVVGPGDPLMLDVEVVAGGADPTYDDVTGIVAAYRGLGGTVTLLYLPEWFWSGHWASPDLQPLAALGLSLISSNYTTYSDTGPGWDPYGGVTPSIWQYTNSASFGGVNGVDFNAYRGTIDELRALFGGRPSTVEDEVAHLWKGTDGAWWYVTGPMQFKRRITNQAEVDSIRYYSTYGPGFTLVDLDKTVGTPTDPAVIPGKDITNTGSGTAPGTLNVTLTGTATPAP